MPLATLPACRADRKVTASDQQARPEVEFPVGQDQCGPVFRLFATRLQLEIDPGQIAAVGMVGPCRDYHTSLPTGGPPSTSPGWSSGVNSLSTSRSVRRFGRCGSITRRSPSTLTSTCDPSARPSCSSNRLGTRRPTLLPQRCKVMGVGRRSEFRRINDRYTDRARPARVRHHGQLGHRGDVGLSERSAIRSNTRSGGLSPLPCRTGHPRRYLS